VAVNHASSVDTVKLRLPVPVLVTLKFAEAGFAPPCTAEKLKLAGEIESTGALVAGKP
jgi:hypothetical protein